MYEPLWIPLKLKLPAESAVVVETDAPTRFSVAPLPPAPLTLPEILKVGSMGRISTMLRLNRSVSGAMSLIETEVPSSAIGEICLCTQMVSIFGLRNW